MTLEKYFQSMVLKYGKKGYEDCIENESLTMSLEKTAVRKIRETVNEEIKEENRGEK